MCFIKYNPITIYLTRITLVIQKQELLSIVQIVSEFIIHYHGEQSLYINNIRRFEQNPLYFFTGKNSKDVPQKDAGKLLYHLSKLNFSFTPNYPDR